MKIVIQRAKNSWVKVESKVVGEIDTGMVLLVCFEKGDQESSIQKAVHKVINMRIFEDPDTGKMSLNIGQINGSALAISQFTLSWDGTGGHRPSFDRSLDPLNAKRLFELFCRELRKHIRVETGIFAAEMEVFITNDGPVTFCLDF